MWIFIYSIIWMLLVMTMAISYYLDDNDIKYIEYSLWRRTIIYLSCATVLPIVIVLILIKILD